MMSFISMDGIATKDIIAWSVQVLLGIIVPVIAYRLGMRSERKKRERIVDELTSKLDIILLPQESEGIQMRVINQTDQTIHNAIVSITMNYSKADILVSTKNNTWIGREILPLSEERLCWSGRIKGEYAYARNIYAEDEVPLSLFRFDKKHYAFNAVQLKNYQDHSMSVPADLVKEYSVLAVASEDGFGKMDGETFKEKRARVFLERKTYTFWLKVVSEDTRAKAWEFEFVDNAEKPIVMKRRVSMSELRSIQNKIRKWENPFS